MIERLSNRGCRGGGCLETISIFGSMGEHKVRPYVKRGIVSRKSYTGTWHPTPKLFFTHWGIV
jgi:hypothetical protein